MHGVLGIDTSNYTTSAAVLDYKSGLLIQKSLPLPVGPGELGLRQSDALFHHTRLIPEILEQLMSEYEGEITAVSASQKPTQLKDSYMPCLLTGAGAARQLAAVLKAPVFMFSHQQGHLAAAALGAGRVDLLNDEFVAFHVSGGTTDALCVRPDAECIIDCTHVAGSLDLKAGQLIDRVGAMLGLGFPAGPQLEKLASQATGEYNVKPFLRGGDCSLSGVENQCRKRLNDGEQKPEIAMLCIKSVLAAVEGMCDWMIGRYPAHPVLFSGGVMSNLIIRSAIERKFGGIFAPAELSSDNAAGIALLGYISTNGGA